MSEAVMRNVRPAAAILKRDFLVATSYRVRFVTGLFSGFVNLLVFYYISRLVRLEDSMSPDQYFAFVAIGSLLYAVVTATLSAPYMMLRQELVAGTFERILLAPGGTIAGIVSLLLFPALYSLLTVIAMLGFATAVFGIDVQFSTLPLALPLAILAVLAFAPFGILLQAGVVLGKKAPPGADYLILGISLIAGFYFPVALLPDWIQWASDVQPFTPAVDVLRWALAGQALPVSAWVEVAKLVGFAAVTLPVSIVALAVVLRKSRRLGTILEY